MHMHRSRIWDTETAQFNCEVQSAPCTGTWQQRRYLASAFCRLHRHHKGGPLSFQGRKRCGHSRVCPAWANVSGTSLQVCYAGTRTGFPAWHCDTLQGSEGHLELKTSFLLQGVDSPERDTETCLIFRYHQHSRNLLLTPQDHKFLQFCIPSSNLSPTEGLNKQPLEAVPGVILLPCFSFTRVLLRQDLGAGCLGTGQHIGVWAPPPFAADKSGKETPSDTTPLTISIFYAKLNGSNIRK